MVTMLETLWGAVLKATQDAESSTTSDAYLTFFKDPENKAFVSNILAQVSEGAAIHPPTSVNNGAPVFRCLDGFGQLAGRLSNGRQYDAFGFCQAHSHSLSQFNLPSTPYVVNKMRSIVLPISEISSFFGIITRMGNPDSEYRLGHLPVFLGCWPGVNA